MSLNSSPLTQADTLWASGYEVYDRISPPFQTFLSTLTTTFTQPEFAALAAKEGFAMYTAARGSPHNSGSSLTASHPVVRTNPVTGWRSLFGAGRHATKINGVAARESTLLLDWLTRLIVDNHDLQVRFRWLGRNDMAVWDERCTFHSATLDYDDQGGEREGRRAVGVGERPYFDAASRSRRDALMEEELELERLQKGEGERKGELVEGGKSG